MWLFLKTLWLFYTPVNIYILNCRHRHKYKYFSVLYSPLKNHNCLLLSFSDRTLAASGAFWLKTTIYFTDLISSVSNTIVVRGFSDDCCYSTTYPGHIVTAWTFWECFVNLPLVVVSAVTIDWQVAQLWLGHKNGGDKTLWRHVEHINYALFYKMLLIQDVCEVLAENTSQIIYYSMLKI